MIFKPKIYRFVNVHWSTLINPIIYHSHLQPEKNVRKLTMNSATTKKNTTSLISEYKINIAAAAAAAAACTNCVVFVTLAGVRPIVIQSDNRYCVTVAKAV
jgi:hypothetical protein